MKKLLVCLWCALLAGCVGMSKVEPGAHVIKDTLEVRLDKAWNRLDVPGMGKQEIWTLEGLPLDTLKFYVGVKEGEALAEIANAKEKQIPKFRAGMQPNEIVELLEAVLSVDGSAFKLSKLSAADFAGTAGFRFEYTLLRKSDEVELRGVAYGAVRQEALTLMVFSAPRVHYFSRLLPRAESVATTARYVGSSVPASVSGVVAAAR